MARSHPPTLIRLAERTLREECEVRRGERLLVGVSGGGDSSALLHVLARLAPRLGVTVVAHGVDHGLRSEATRELDLAESLAASLGVRFDRTRVEVGKGGNLQARARTARRHALERAVAKEHATRLATAHHADDRAETVLIRLLHGARPEGLAVLPARDGIFVRPLVRARKADVLAHLARHDIAYAEDPSNADPRFLRVRVRRELMPLLEELSPRIVEHLTALADEVAEDLGGAQGQREHEARPVSLRRAQLQAVRRAVALGGGARIRLAGGVELVVADRAPTQKGGAKREKSG